MKKCIIKFVLPILIICCLLSSLPVYAFTIPTVLYPEISLSDVNAKPDDEVEVNITISDNPGIAYLKLKIDYDPDLFVIKAENKGILAGTFTTSKTTDVKPYVLQWMAADDSLSDGVIATVTFKVSADASDGEKPITVTVEECCNSHFDDVVFDTVNGSVKVKKSTHIPGDINDDGKVNNKDLTRLFQYLSDWDVKVNEAALDVNGDGKHNNKDLTRLFQYLSDCDVRMY